MVIKYLRDEECKGKGILQPEKMNCVISLRTWGSREGLHLPELQPTQARCARKLQLTEFQAGKNLL